MKTKTYYIIEYNSPTINIIRDMLPKGPLSILWCNGGMYAIIPGAILEEMFESSKPPRKRMADQNWSTRIWWEQAYELPREVGQLLCDSAYNGG